MNFFLSIEVALREIWAHRFRSLLSMLGIILGVSSLLATLSLTAGMEKGARENLEQMGGIESVDIIFKEPSREMEEFLSLSPSRTQVDASAIKSAAPLISHVSPEVSFGAAVSTFGIEPNRYSIMGAWPDYLPIKNLDVIAGRSLTDFDVETASHAVVIGASIANKLWPQMPVEEVLGKVLFINDIAFKVVGVMPFYDNDYEKKRRALGSNEAENARRMRRGQRTRTRDPYRQKNEAVIIPFPTMFYDFLSGSNPLESLDSYRVSNISLKVKDVNYFDQALDQARAALERTHRGVDDFGFETKESWMENINTYVKSVSLTGGIIAGISLIVGGIGIANIMLASISERVREIGIRRAVGARAKDIFLQIIVESVSIAIIGAVLGIFSGVGLMQLLEILSPEQNAPILQASSIVISTSFAVLAGVLSGIYPALRASRLDPITALRYE